MYKYSSHCLRRSPAVHALPAANAFLLCPAHVAASADALLPRSKWVSLASIKYFPIKCRRLGFFPSPPFIRALFLAAFAGRALCGVGQEQHNGIILISATAIIWLGLLLHGKSELKILFRVPRYQRHCSRRSLSGRAERTRSRRALVPITFFPFTAAEVLV